jgi:hypothetical protein
MPLLRDGPRSAGPAAPAGASLPAALDDAGDVALERQLAEAEAAEGELPDVRARPAAQPAAVAMPDRELRASWLRNLSPFFAVVAILRSLSARPERHAEQLQQLAASSSVLAVVTTETFMPRALSTFM